MFTRRHKLKLDGHSDLPEIAQSKPQKNRPDASRDSDEIEKISQDFQVAQLESLKEMGGSAPHLAPDKNNTMVSNKSAVPATKKDLKPSLPTPLKTESPTIELPTKLVTPQSPAQPAVSEKPTPTVFTRPLESAKPPKALLQNLLNEIVEQDIQRLRQRLNGKK